MSVVVASGALRAAVTPVAAAAAADGMIPILGCLMVEAADGAMRLFANNLGLSVERSLPAAGEIAAVAVKASAFKAAVDGMPPGDLALAIERYRLVVTSGKARRTLPTLAARDMPLPLVPDDAEPFAVSAGALASALRFCAPAISREEFRYYLGGVYFHCEGGHLRCVATDRHQLRCADLEGVPAPAGLSAILPRFAVDALLRGMCRREAEIEVTVGAKRATFTAGEETIGCSLIEGTFPSYQRIIPSDAAPFLVATGEEVARAAGVIAAFADKDGSGLRSLAMTVAPDDLSLSVTGAEGSAVEPIHGADAVGEIKIGFNAAYLRGAGEAFGESVIEFAARDALSPALLTAPDKPNLRAVLMPMRI